MAGEAGRPGRRRFFDVALDCREGDKGLASSQRDAGRRALHARRTRPPQKQSKRKQMQGRGSLRVTSSSSTWVPAAGSQIWEVTGMAWMAGAGGPGGGGASNGARTIRVGRCRLEKQAGFGLAQAGGHRQGQDGGGWRTRRGKGRRRVAVHARAGMRQAPACALARAAARRPAPRSRPSRCLNFVTAAAHAAAASPPPPPRPIEWQHSAHAALGHISPRSSSPQRPT